MTPQPIEETRELAVRAADGVEVSLLWHPSRDYVSVTVLDAKAERGFELVVADDENALDVFHHPYAHAAWRGMDVEVPAGERELEPVG